MAEPVLTVEHLTVGFPTRRGTLIGVDGVKGATVDAKGCPSDADGDGVLDAFEGAAIAADTSSSAAVSTVVVEVTAAALPVATQARILRVLTEQTFQRLKSNVKVQVDVRVISSTARDIEHEIAEGRFREDLFHRLNVIRLRLPAEKRKGLEGVLSVPLISRAGTARLTPRKAVNAVLPLPYVSVT